MLRVRRVAVSFFDLRGEKGEYVVGEGDTEDGVARWFFRDVHVRRRQEARSKKAGAMYLILRILAVAFWRPGSPYFPSFLFTEDTFWGVSQKRPEGEDIAG